MQNNRIPSLAEAAAAWLQIRDSFLDDDCREQVSAARSDYRRRFPNVDWHTRRNGHLDILAGELAKLTGDSLPDCLTAMKTATGCDWSSTARREIVEYAKRLSMAERRSA